jgi:hypothetical protein
MILALDCVGPSFNISTTAGYYAQMTGLLAGFGFTAMVVLLTPTQVEGRGFNGRAKDNGVLLVLLAAFVALTLSTLMYSVLAGESSDQARGRAATVELVDGLPFGLAVIMLFYGITLLMQGGHIDRMAVWVARVMTIVVAPTLTFYYIGSGVSDTESVRIVKETGICTSAGLPTLGLVLTIALATMLTMSVVPQIQAVKWRLWARKLQNLVPVTVLLVSVAAAVASGDLSTRSPEFLLSKNAVTVYLVGTFLLLALLGLLLAFSRVEEDAPDEPSDEELHVPKQLEPDQAQDQGPSLQK